MICALTMLILAVPRLRARNPRAERIFVSAALLALFAVSLTINLRIIREYSEIMNGPKPAREARKEKLETAADILYWPFGKSVMIEAERISSENVEGLTVHDRTDKSSPCVCPKCAGTAKIYDSLNDVPKQETCLNCDSEFAVCIENLRVLYRRL